MTKHQFNLVLAPCYLAMAAVNGFVAVQYHSTFAGVMFPLFCVLFGATLHDVIHPIHLRHDPGQVRAPAYRGLAYRGHTLPRRK